SNPGATTRFALFGEVLQTGLLVTLVGLAVITLPVGLAAGIRHLRRFVAAEDSRAALFWTDVRRGLPGGALVGAVAAIVAGVLVTDILLARSGALPGGALVECVGWAGLVAVAVAVQLACAQWRPEDGWMPAVRGIPGAMRTDAVGTLYLAAAAVFVGVATWALPPLFLPAIGCVALAVVAVPARRRRR